MTEIPALVIAGGLGTRLRASVADRPKVLAEVAGEPFVAHLLRQLADAGVRRTVLCTGYLAPMVAETLGQRFAEMTLDYSVEDEPLGTGGALALARERLDVADTVLALNGDSYVDVDLAGLIAHHRRHGAAATLTLARVDDTTRFGRVEIDGHGTVTSFVEKGGAHGPGLINAGVYVLDSAVLESIPSGRKVSLEREVLPGLIGRGLVGFESAGRFLDIGTPRTYAAADRFFADLHSAPRPEGMP